MKTAGPALYARTLVLYRRAVKWDRASLGHFEQAYWKGKERVRDEDHHTDEDMQMEEGETMTERPTNTTPAPMGIGMDLQ